MNTQRTLPVATYSGSSAGNVSVANVRQYGHWKSDISYTVTGAVAEPARPAGERVRRLGALAACACTDAGAREQYRCQNSVTQTRMSAPSISAGRRAVRLDSSTVSPSTGTFQYHSELGSVASQLRA